MAIALNNLQLIAEKLDFESDDEFYTASILQRRKDNPEMESAVRLIRHYRVRSVEYLEKRFEEMRQLAHTFNARVVINLNPRSYRKTTLRAMELMIRGVRDDQFKMANAWDKAAGQVRSGRKKLWVLDVDEPSEGPNPGGRMVDTAVQVCEWLEQHHAAVAEAGFSIPSKTGVHLVTPAFDPRTFTSHFPEVAIKRDSPVNLYIPDFR